MNRLLTLAILAGTLAGLAAPAHAQSRYDQNGPTATGDPWLNENDFDYNRRHWTPPNRAYQDQNRYNYGEYDRRNDGYRNYDRRDYGDYGNGDRYDPRYDRRYENRSSEYGYQDQYGRSNRGYYDNRGYGYGRAPQPQYPDDDE